MPTRSGSIFQSGVGSRLAGVARSIMPEKRHASAEAPPIDKVQTQKGLDRTPPRTAKHTALLKCPAPRQPRGGGPRKRHVVWAEPQIVPAAAGPPKRRRDDGDDDRRPREGQSGCTRRILGAGIGRPKPCECGGLGPWVVGASDRTPSNQGSAGVERSGGSHALSAPARAKAFESCCWPVCGSASRGAIRARHNLGCCAY